MLGKWISLSAISCAICASVIAECPSPTSDIDIYPSAKRVPENLLRIYLYFPRPMGGEISESDIRLIGPGGEEIAQAFLPMRFELWSSDRRRLTLILDPGRGKTGLASHERLGRALEVGDGFELRVSGALEDSTGCVLGEDTAFGFSVRTADLDALLPQTWSIDVPVVGTRAALKVDLGRPHDHLSMAYRIRIQGGDGEPIAGRIGLDQHERVWVFVPRDPWSASVHTIVIDDRLEDLAGNRPGIAFDRISDAAKESWAREITFVPLP